MSAIAKERALLVAFGLFWAAWVMILSYGIWAL